MDRQLVRSLLETHRPADAIEAVHRQRMLALLDTAAPFERSQFEPGHFTASAFVVHEDRLLLIWHSKLHRWLQPGGHVDAEDADLAAAAARELREEAGVVATSTVVLDVDVHPIPPNPKRGEPGHEHFDVRFLFHVHHGDAVAGDDAGDVRWVPIAELTAQLTDASVMRAVAKLRQAQAPAD